MLKNRNCTQMSPIMLRLLESNFSTHTHTDKGKKKRSYQACTQSYFQQEYEQVEHACPIMMTAINRTNMSTREVAIKYLLFGPQLLNKVQRTLESPKFLIRR